MKRFLAVLLTLAMVLALAGCSDAISEVKDSALDFIDEKIDEARGEQQEEEPEEPEETEPEETEPEETEPEETEPEPTEAPVYDSFYYFYDYRLKDYTYSDVATFHAVTGTECTSSALDFGFLEADYEEIVDGYDDHFAVFLYPYDSDALDAYITYLESVGFAYHSSESFNEGTSYYYENGENGFMFDLFILKDDTGAYTTTVVEPCMNKLAPEEEYYDFYDYDAREYLDSELLTYHSVTGAECTASALDFGFLSVEGYEDIVDGYDERYAVFIYEYDADELERYFDYLEEMGYSLVTTQNYSEGTSTYYQNADNGYTLDIFLLKAASGGVESVVIEPYLNGDAL